MKTTKLCILTIIISLNTVFAQQSDTRAPEATAAEHTVSFRDIPYLTEAFIDATPADRNDGITMGELGRDGENKAMIVTLAQEIADHKHGDYDGLLISHKNKLVFESYYKKGRVNLPHFQSSATKGYTTLVLGRAIQLGYLTMADLDRPLVSFLKDLDSTKFVAGAEKITLHKAMTMRSGIRIGEEKRKELDENPSQLQGQGLVQAWLEHSAPITKASQSYSYSFDPDLVMQVIEAVVPGTAQDFIKNELLDKMGITKYRWQTGLSGLPEAGWPVSMTSRDMIKWGALILNKGKWNGEQLVPEAFVTKATSVITQPTEDWQPKTYRYGYYWYRTNIIVSNKSYTANMAWGGGGIHLIVLEALDLVIAITGHDREDTIMDQVVKTVIPAFVKDKVTVLEDRYFSEKPPGLTPKLFEPKTVSPEGSFEGGIFSPDMKEFYFTRKNGKYKKRTFFVIHYENNRWGQESETDIRWPQFAADGNMMYVGKEYRKRTEIGWSKPKSLGRFLKEQAHGMSVSSKGTFYFPFFKEEDNGQGNIGYSRLVNGKYETPVKMGAEINTGNYIAHPYISPDESYLMWDVEREDGYGQADIYISFRHKDGSWLPAINMGPLINTALQESSPRVTHDGKYLFFSRGEWKVNEDGSTNWVGKSYWVDAQVIENLRVEQ
ncbi:MAG: serine hydrolase [Bacteroidota bacterium]